MKSTDTVLAALAGYVDTLSFVALFGLFTAHVTGNFVLIGAALTGHGQGVFLKLLVFPAFIAGVALASVLTRAAPKGRPDHAARLLYAVQGVLMLGFGAAGLMAAPIGDAENTWVLLAGVLGTFAMGIQNAHSRVIQRPGVPNTVMTGNVTQAVLDTVELLSPTVDDPGRSSAKARLAKLVPAIVGFACGAVAGAFAYQWIGFWALLAPAAVLVWLACRATGDH